MVCVEYNYSSPETIEIWDSELLLLIFSFSSFHLQNISEGKYKNFEEFKADAQLIVHNTAILHGGQTDEVVVLEDFK